MAADFVGVGAGGVSGTVAGDALGLDVSALRFGGLTAPTFGLMIAKNYKVKRSLVGNGSEVMEDSTNLDLGNVMVAP